MPLRFGRYAHVMMVTAAAPARGHNERRQLETSERIEFGVAAAKTREEWPAELDLDIIHL